MGRNKILSPFFLGADFKIETRREALELLNILL
jgi:hypothetical protein